MDQAHPRVGEKRSADASEDDRERRRPRFGHPQGAPLVLAYAQTNADNGNHRAPSNCPRAEVARLSGHEPTQLSLDDTAYQSAAILLNRHSLQHPFAQSILSELLRVSAQPGLDPFSENSAVAVQLVNCLRRHGLTADKANELIASLTAAEQQRILGSIARTLTDTAQLAGFIGNLASLVRVGPVRALLDHWRSDPRLQREMAAPDLAPPPGLQDHDRSGRTTVDPRSSGEAESSGAPQGAFAGGMLGAVDSTSESPDQIPATTPRGLVQIKTELRNFQPAQPLTFTSPDIAKLLQASDQQRIQGFKNRFASPLDFFAFHIREARTIDPVKWPSSKDDLQAAARELWRMLSNEQKETWSMLHQGILGSDSELLDSRLSRTVLEQQSLYDRARGDFPAHAGSSNEGVTSAAVADEKGKAPCQQMPFSAARPIGFGTQIPSRDGEATPWMAAFVSRAGVDHTPPYRAGTNAIAIAESDLSGGEANDEADTGADTSTEATEVADHPTVEPANTMPPATAAATHQHDNMDAIIISNTEQRDKDFIAFVVDTPDCQLTGLSRHDFMGACGGAYRQNVLPKSCKSISRHIWIVACASALAASTILESGRTIRQRGVVLHPERLPSRPSSLFVSSSLFNGVLFEEELAQRVAAMDETATLIRLPVDPAFANLGRRYGISFSEMKHWVRFYLPLLRSNGRDVYKARFDPTEKCPGCTRAHAPGQICSRVETVTR